jgi:uncharacterized protein (TIGR00255 family)
MTGYGWSATDTEYGNIRVEMRAVNYKELKISSRLPDSLRLKESELENIIRKHISRGHVYLTVNLNLTEKAMTALIDQDKLHMYLDLATGAASGSKTKVVAEAASILSLPGVIDLETMPTEVRDALWETVKECTEEATRHLVAMRQAEGDHLAEQIESLSNDISKQLGKIESQSDQCLREYRDRLYSRIKELIDSSTPTDEQAITREAASTAERSDVSEEIIRLKSHLQQFSDQLRIENNGKKLEFFAQEMQREANTLASKLPSTELVNAALEIKSDVHQLREQLRNVE